ncbi:MAG: primosomal protein DnaI, partial [Streptococcus mitis]|nr:primosomal protein DnaI [Streptococcus mitis]
MEKYGAEKTILQIDNGTSTTLKNLEIERLLQNKTVDGIFCTDDLTAITVMNIAQKLKISIPEELKVIGYDGTKLIKRIAPQLSTIVQPIDEMCDVMIDLLLRRMKDPDVAAFIQQESLSPEELNRSISKFNQYITERDKFLRGDTDYIAKGYKPILVMNHGYADVSYEETPELIAAEKEAAIKNRLKLINLPASLRKASLAQVDLDDLERLPVFEKLLAFVEQYPAIRKGLYLYGDFGVGKSFMVAALAHDLSEKRGVSSTLLHYPSFVIDVKNAIGDGNVKTLVDEIKLSEVLILDDIGAEQSTAWVRDEILQVILQYRMQENLPTFF